MSLLGPEAECYILDLKYPQELLAFGLQLMGIFRR
jgi:hypothetical protein